MPEKIRIRTTEDSKSCITKIRYIFDEEPYKIKKSDEVLKIYYASRMIRNFGISRNFNFSVQVLSTPRGADIYVRFPKKFGFFFVKNQKCTSDIMRRIEINFQIGDKYGF